MKSFAVTNTIHATPEAVWALLTDAPGYPSWNTTVSGITGRIAPGETLTVAVRLLPDGHFRSK